MLSILPLMVDVLHGFTAVAALKLHSLCQRLAGNVHVLHGFTAVAALKHVPGVVVAGLGGPFSTASPPWPH